jgi:hypothetical protein
MEKTLVIITADTCSACTRFKGFELEKLKKNLPEKVKLVHIDLPDMDSNVPENYSSELNNYLAWFPMFILFNTYYWNKGMVEDGNIMNGYMTEKGPEHNQDNIPSRADDIIKWIDRKVLVNTAGKN